MMKHGKKLAAILLAAAMTASGMALAACDNGGTTDNPPASATDVTGTYTINYSTTEISGNVRHTGFLTAMQSTETNTLVLKADGTYEYTKAIASHRDDTATRSSVNAAREANENLLFAFDSAGDGNCTFECYKDGTYKFTFTTYNVSETGAWTWDSWTFKVKKSDDSEITATMDESTHALEFTYVAVQSAQLTHPFTCSATTWGAAFGGQGSYTPTTTPDTPSEATTAVMYYTGEGQKSTEYNGQTVTYDVTLHVFMLSTGEVYAVEATDTNSNVTIGSWTATEDNSSVTVTIGDDTQSGAPGRAKLTFGGIETSFSTAMPDEYKTADWDALVAAAKTPAPGGPIAISYKFTGTYTNSGYTVTLNPATACTWSEDWGIMQNQGFTNVSGTANDVVRPKGATGESYLPLDHFGGKYYMATTNATTVTNNVAVKVTVKTDGSFEYVEESVFD